MAREVKRSHLDKNYDESQHWTAIPLSLTTRNYQLELKYAQKKLELRAEGRTEDEVRDRTLFGCCDRYDDVEAVFAGGLHCGMKFLNSCLGNASKGVSLGKHADVLLRKRYDDGLRSCWMVIFKVMYGRVKGVLPIQTPPYREPALEADCHCSFISPSLDDPLHLQEIKSQVYMFERDAMLSTSFSQQPRQCVPVAVIMYNRAGSLTDAVDLRLVAHDQPVCDRPEPPVSTARCGHGDVSVVVGQAGHRRVTVTGLDGTLDHPQTSQRTVSFCPSGAITKITINNDRERSDTATTAAVRSSNLSAPEVPHSATTSPENVQSAALASSTDADTSANSDRSQYSHLIRRRKKTLPSGTPTEPSAGRTARDLSSPPLPKPGDTPLTLLHYQKSLVSNIAKQLSAELSAITSFLRVTKPAHIDDRERVAVQSMQHINAAFQRLTPACITYRRFCGSTCSGVSQTALQDVDDLRTHDTTLRRCRDKLISSFSERRDVILQTPIAGEQRLFTFVWLQRHSAAIVDSINVVVDVLEAVLKHATTSSIQTPPDDVKPNVSELNAESGNRMNESIDEARPPSLTPAIKTDIVTADEPPVLQPSIYPRLRETPDNAISSNSPSITAADQRNYSQNAQHGSIVYETTQLESPTPDVPVVSLALKQEQPENLIPPQSCTASTETVSADICETLDQSQLADELVADMPGEDADDAMQDEPSHDQIQRLLDARDQRAFTQLLIDSVCSMPTDDFNRVREKLIRKFINDQRRSAASFGDIEPGQVIAKVEPTTDEQLDEGTQADASTVTQNEDINTSSSSSSAAATATALSLKIVNVRSCSSEDTDGSWSHNMEPSASVADQLTVKREKLDHCTDVGENENVIAANYITIVPIETTPDAANTDSTRTGRHDDETQERHDTQPASTALGNYTDVEEQRSRTDVDDSNRRKQRDSSDSPTRCSPSANTRITSPLRLASPPAPSRRRKPNRRSGRQPPYTPPWLHMSRSPQRNHSSPSPVAGCGSFRFPSSSPFIRHYSFPLTSQTSPLKYRRCTDVRFPSADRDASGWLSELTPWQQRGAMSLHCCVSLVSRCLHATGACQYAGRVTDNRDRQRQMIDNLFDQYEWTNRIDSTGGPNTATAVSDAGRDNVASHYTHTQPVDARQNANSKQRTPETYQPYCTSLFNNRSNCMTTGNSDQRIEPRRRARSRSNSDSDSSHRPCILDMRDRPKRKYPGLSLVRNWRTMQEELWHNRTEIQGRRSTTSRSAERKSNKEKPHRYSMSSERSSSSASSTRSGSKSKDQRSKVKHPSADKRSDKTESVKTNNAICHTAIDNKKSENLHKNTYTDTQPSPNTGVEVDNVVKLDQNDDHRSTDDVVGIHSSNSLSEPMINTSKTSDTVNETVTDSSSTQASPSKISATSNSSLQNTFSSTVFKPKVPTADKSEVNKVELESEHKLSHDSRSTKKADEANSTCSGADDSRISRSAQKDRHSRSGSRSTTRNSRKSTEATKSENSDSHNHGHRKESSSNSRGKRKRHSSKKRSRSRSGDRRKRQSSKHGDDHHTHRTKSRRERHDCRRSHRRWQSRSSSRERNSSSSSSDKGHYSSTKYNRKRDTSISNEDSHRHKTESKRLKKLQKKAERALQKFQLELNNKESNLHWKKSLEIPTARALISASQDLDVNSNKCDWNNAQIISDKPGCDPALNIFDADFIALYTSPVSSPSMWSDMESNSGDNLESFLEQRSDEKQRDENVQQTSSKNNSENFVTTCDSNDTPPSCIVENCTPVVSVASDVRNDKALLTDSESIHDTEISQTITTSDALKAVAVAYDDETAEVDSAALQYTGLQHDRDKMDLKN